MTANLAYFIALLIVIIMIFAVSIALLRWALRINEIIKHLELSTRLLTEISESLKKDQL